MSRYSCAAPAVANRDVRGGMCVCVCVCVCVCICVCLCVCVCVCALGKMRRGEAMCFEYAWECEVEDA